MNNYKAALLLDLDGTLVDTANDFIAAIKAVCSTENMPAPRDSDIRATVSAGGSALTTLTFDLDDTHPEFASKKQLLLDTYLQTLGQHSCVFTGFDEVLDYCEQNRIAWGIITNKPWQFTEPLLNKLGITPSNNVVICPDHVAISKPDPEGLLLAANKLGLEPPQCIYAGDHQRDIEAGINANMATIACAYGYVPKGEQAQDWQANHTVQHARDILDIIQGFTPSNNG